MFPRLAAFYPLDCHSVCSLSLSPADRESPALPGLHLAGPAWPHPARCSRGSRASAKPPCSSLSLGLGPSLMVHTPCSPEFPGKVASAPSPLPGARLQHAETMEAPSQTSNRAAVKSPTASGDRGRQLKPWLSHSGYAWAFARVEGRKLGPEVMTPGFESQPCPFLAAWSPGK